MSIPANSGTGAGAGPSRPSSTLPPLTRQTSLTDPAALVVAFPELERGMSGASSKSRGRTGARLDAGNARRAASAISEERDHLSSNEEKTLGIGGDEKGDEVDDGSETREELTFPDGGFAAWTVVFGGFWTVFCGFGLASTIGAFQTLYRSTFLISYSESQIAWIASLQSFFTFGLSCFTGALFDKWGHKPLIATGTFFLTLGFCMLSLCTEYYQLMLVHSTLLPWGANLLFMCPIAVVGQWFQKRRGLAFGLMSTGSSLGSVCWPLILANLPQRIGFGWTCRLMALICALCGTLAFFLLKTRLPPKPAGTFFYFKAFRSLQYNCVVLNFICFGFAFFAFLTFIGTYGQLAGLGTLAPYLLIIQNGTSVIGRLGSGILADRIGTYNTNIIGNFVFVVGYFCWLAVKNTTTGLLVITVIMGIAGGSFVCLQPPLAVMTATDMRYGGTMMGQALFVMAFAQLACGPSFGALIGTGTNQERYDSFFKGIVLCACLSLVGASTIVVARWNRQKKLWAKA